MSTLTFSPEAKEQLTMSEEQLQEAIFANRNPILHDEYYRGDMPIIFRDLLTNELFRLDAKELSFRHLEEIVKNTVKVEKNGDYLVEYLRQLYPDKQFTFSLYGDNAEHIVCELQAELLGTCVVGVAKPDGDAVYLFARQLPLGFEEALINGDMNFYGSRKSYRDYTSYILEVLCSEKNLDPTVKTAATTDTDYEEAPIPTKEEIFNARIQPEVTNVKKICEKFLLATDSEREVHDFHRKPADVIDISKAERDVRENVRLFYWPAQTFFECHPLDLTLEELIAIYQHDIFIAYNEQSFYKYETVIRIAHGMKP